METTQFLLSTHAKLQGLRAARSAYASQFAPDFNLIDLLSPGELGLSNLLRELLDPRGSHAQGRRFLDGFIQLLGLTDLVANREVLSVATEAPTDANQQSGRRIDILIELAGPTSERKFAIAIENKPWAADGADQVKDYLRHLEARYRDGYVLIYLPGHEDRTPGGHSIEKEAATIAIAARHLVVSCYAHLLPWLSTCRAQCEAPAVQAFIQSFEKYIYQTFLGVRDMTERQQLITDAISSAATVELALELSLAQSDIKGALLKKLHEQFVRGVKKDGYSWELPASFDISDWKRPILIQLSPGDKFTVGFGFDQPGGGNFFYGILKNAETDEVLLDIKPAMDNEFNARGKSHGLWLWYQDFEPSLRDWRYSSKPWAQIASGVMAEWMITTVAKIEKRLRQNQLKSGL
ncbi:PD-(D/E)XK nuclease family protein [Polaromonas sp.]|uniref:PDDEXK-like family protein n=1 Tax=Polaromonas sp. TaxID=1869339 RepID=UPI00286C0A8B|nr:PD-(D/E)XK nuclease family protein [Polaromonas sp.]